MGQTNGLTQKEVTRKMKKQGLQYTIQNNGDEVVIYTRTSKDEEFDFCVSFPVKYEDGKPMVSLFLVNKLIELSNFGYKQVP